MVKLNKFNKQNLPEIRRILNVALEDVGTLLGVSVALGGASYRDHTVKFDLSLQTLSDDGENQQDKADFIFYSQNFGFEASDFGKDFTIRHRMRGRQYKIIGWSPRRYKYPLKAIEVFTGDIYYFQPRTVLRAMGKETGIKFKAPSFT